MPNTTEVFLQRNLTREKMVLFLFIYSDIQVERYVFDTLKQLANANTKADTSYASASSKGLYSSDVSFRTAFRDCRISDSDRKPLSCCAAPAA